MTSPSGLQELIERLRHIEELTNREDISDGGKVIFIRIEARRALTNSVREIPNG
jgi:hypothetical protein